METSTHSIANGRTFQPAVTSHEIKDIEELSYDLKRLLVRHENTLKEEGIRDEVETLEQWMDSYREGLKAANRISEKGTDCLMSLRDRLMLLVEETHRLEGEGGNPPSREQAERTEDLLKTIKRIDGVLPDFEQLFAAAPHSPAHHRV